MSSARSRPRCAAVVGGGAVNGTEPAGGEFSLGLAMTLTSYLTHPTTIPQIRTLQAVTHWTRPDDLAPDQMAPNLLDTGTRLLL